MERGRKREKSTRDGRAVCVGHENIPLCLTPETDCVENVGGLPSIELSIERDKTDLDVAGMPIASMGSRSDPQI